MLAAYCNSSNRVVICTYVAFYRKFQLEHLPTYDRSRQSTWHRNRSILDDPSYLRGLCSVLLSMLSRFDIDSHPHRYWLPEMSLHIQKVILVLPVCSRKWQSIGGTLITAPGPRWARNICLHCVLFLSKRAMSSSLDGTVKSIKPA